MTSHRDRLLLDKTLTIVLLKLHDEKGASYFAYLALKPAELKKLVEANRKGLFNPNEYGTLLLAGKGSPTEEVRKFMEEQYGFDHINTIDIE